LNGKKQIKRGEIIMLNSNYGVVVWSTYYNKVMASYYNGSSWSSEIEIADFKYSDNIK
jgi:hypothetical protein